MLSTFLLLDRTGSMQRRWEEAVSAINTYVTDLRKAIGEDLLQDDDRITLAVFDRMNGMQFDVLRDFIPLSQWKPLTTIEVTPRGDTPLLDAVVRMAALAEAKNVEKTVLVIMTDGEENASTEVTKDGAKAALDRLRTKGWQVVFLGADFNAFAQAGMLGIVHGQTLSTPSGHYQSATSSTAHLTADYRDHNIPMSYSDKDRKDAGEDDITGGKPL
jgi:hypothetical protein